MLELDAGFSFYAEVMVLVWLSIYVPSTIDTLHNDSSILTFYMT